MVGVSVFQLLTQTPPLESKKKMEIDVLTAVGIYGCGYILQSVQTKSFSVPSKMSQR